MTACLTPAVMALFTRRFRRAGCYESVSRKTRVLNLIEKSSADCRRLLFTDAKTLENFTQQVVAAERTGDLAQLILRLE